MVTDPSVEDPKLYSTALSSPLSDPRKRVDARIIAGLCIAGFACMFPSLVDGSFFLSGSAGSLLLIAAAYLREEVRADLLDYAVWLPAGLLLSVVLLAFTIATCPHTIDASLEASPYSGVGVARDLMSLAQVHHALGDFFEMVYYSLSFAMAAGLAVAPHPKKLAWSMVKAAVIAVPIYCAFPAVGPIGGPNHIGARNCIPSMHFGFAVLLVGFTKGWFRAAFVIFAVLTAVSTLTTGEHYVIDLAVALPYAALITWISR